MKHLKLHHNYSSLKMKYMQEEFPLLAATKSLGDGFGHMVEKDEEEEPVSNPGETTLLESQNEQIAALQAQLSDQNEIKQKLTEARARIDQLKRDKWVKTCDIPKEFFEYNDETD